MSTTRRAMLLGTVASVAAAMVPVVAAPTISPGFRRRLEAYREAKAAYLALKARMPEGLPFGPENTTWENALGDADSVVFKTAEALVAEPAEAVHEAAEKARIMLAEDFEQCSYLEALASDLERLAGRTRT